MLPFCFKSVHRVPTNRIAALGVAEISGNPSRIFSLRGFFQHDQIDTTTFTFDTKKTLVIDPDGNTVATLTDGFGRQVGTIDQLGNLTEQEFDSAGNVKKVIDALSNETVYAYDDLNRNTSVTDPLSNTTETVYNSTTGWVTSTEDAKGNTTTNTYDALGRVVTVTDRLGNDTDRTYDDVGRLLTITDAQSKTTTYGYDDIGQRTSVTLADSSSRAMTYDPAGRMIKMEAPSGKYKTTTYEFSGVVDKHQYYDASDTLTGTDDFTYDSILRKTGSTSQYGVTRALAYTDRGELDTDTTTYSSQSYVVDYDYDDRGRRTKVTYPSGHEADYTYDDRSMLETIAWESSQIEDRGYSDLGQLTSVDRPYIDESRTYDDAGRLTAVNNNNVGNASYTYDENGNKQSETWTGNMSGWSFTTANTGTYTDGYDAEDRLRNFKQPTKSVDLYLDRSDTGNITNYKLGSTNAYRSYSDIHELTTVDGTSQTFDADGNLTDAHTGIELDWDEGGMLEQTVVSSGDSAGIEGANEYGYDAERKRVWKKITRNSSVAEHIVFIYAGPNCIAEYDAGTAATSPNQEYVFANAIDSLVMIVRNSGAQKLTVTRNQQWSIAALADNSTGTVLERYTYDALGSRTILAADGSTVRTSSSYDNPYGYTSRRHDDESGLMYFRARYYDPSTGEFTSQDPLGFVDGMSVYRGYFNIAGQDPSGQRCILLRSDFPQSIMPDSDPYLAAGDWRFIAVPYRIGDNFSKTNVNCDECTVDVEMTAKARRYYRHKLPDTFLGWDGIEIGDQNDPRNFASLLLVKVCFSNWRCCNKERPDSTRIVKHIFYTGGLGTYIQNPPRGLRSNSYSFEPTNSCIIGEEFIDHLRRTTSPGDGKTPQVPSW